MKQNKIAILPSLLSADLLNLGEEICAIQQAQVDFLHLDIMDNHYVPNLTFGPQLCKTIHQAFPDLLLDVHLMITPVDDMIIQFAKAGAHRISIHPEATNHIDRSLQLIKEQGCKAGLVCNPATSIESLRWCHIHLDFVLLMTVNPGFGGQQLIPHMIPKIAEVRALYPDLIICVDGGITLENCSDLVAAGANELVAGSTIFKSDDYSATIRSLRRAAVNSCVP